MKNGFMDNRGFTMLEVLVALLILAVGLLGLAGLQLRSMTGGHDAYSRTQATQYASDIVGRMMANRGDSTTGEYDINLGEVLEANCETPSSFACDDLFEWKDLLSGVVNATGGLPGGRGSVAVDTVTNIATVVVEWTDNNGTSEIQIQARLQ